MNKYGVKFYDIYEKITDNLFVIEKIKVNGKDFNVLRFDITPELLENCIEISEEKAHYTMDKDQNGKDRPHNVKVAKQLCGVIAETMTHIFLIEVCGIPIYEIKRWDLERPNFKYSKLEYDVMFSNNGKDTRIEVRNSYSYISIENYCTTGPILGSYTNFAKVGEDVNDLYIRPLSQCFVYAGNTTEEKELFKQNIIEHIKKKDVVPYLVSGTTVAEMYGKNGHKTNMGQNNTEYQAYPIKLAGDILEFANTVKTSYLSSAIKKFIDNHGSLVSKVDIKKDIEILKNVNDELKYRCKGCYCKIPENVYHYAMCKFHTPYCRDCQEKHKKD